MKKLLVFLFSLFILLGFVSCSENDSPTESKTPSDVRGDWGVNMERYSGMSLVEKLDVYLTIDETSGAITGSGTVAYVNSGSSSTQMNVENSVSGFYQSNQSPNIIVTVGAQANSTPPFTFSGDWDVFGEKFKGQVVINSGNQLYTLTDQSFYKRGN